ncbi:hypothetical protein THRCLA_10227 [Thraustotheca clavata]|uniref:Ankyrin repeat-containing domain n=1 Tax=Thraustotheca clavata TaxID=74557 RepID=A0A1V9YRZ9_9STRA|nr:hypothetical protein THRCLA_10227 [Thraustotheca clavata]
MAHICPLKLAAICGHLEIVKLLMNASNKVWTAEAMDLAAMNGHLDVVRFIHNLENGPGCTTQAMDDAATFGHLEVVQFLNENRTEGCTSKALEGEVNKGYGDVVEYLLSHQREQFSPSSFFYPEYYRIQCHRASEYKDYIGVIRCLSNRPFANISEDPIMNAIEANALIIMKFLHHENICGITKNILDRVIEIGDQAAIRYAVESWIPLDNEELLSHSNWGDKEWNNSNAMDIAATLGGFRTVILLHRTWIMCCTVEAMNKAAAIGRLDIVEWLHTHRTEGCTDDAMTYAAARGHFNVVKWLHEFGYTKSGLSTAAYNGDAELVNDFFGGCGNQMVYMPGSTPTIEVFCGVAVDRAASNGHTDIVEILQDFPATTYAMDIAAYNGHLDMIKYLHTHHSEGCSAEAYKNAVRTNHFDILEYLVTSNCCNGDIELCISASGYNNVDIVTFCLNQLQTELTPKLKQLMMYKAAMFGQLEILHDVKGFGCTSITLQEAERRGPEGTVRYLNAIGYYENNVLEVESLWIFDMI